MEQQSFFGEFFSLFYSDSFLKVLSIFLITMPYWLPVVLAVTIWNLWLRYIRKRYILDQKMTLLEVVLPMEIRRSPKAMEHVFDAIHIGPNESTWWNNFVAGKVRPWWSFEIASIGGEIHFFIWTRTFMRNNVESAIYGQYPDVEIREIKEDYARMAQLVPGKTRMWGCDFALDKPDAYPIKTYIDYGLDREGVKEEEKVDPIAPFLEYMSTIGKGEQIWFQIIIQQTKKRDRINRKFPDWKAEALKEVERLREETMPKNVPEGQSRFPNPTKGQAERIGAIERSISKLGFNAGVRMLYIADESVYNPHHIPGIIASVKHYNSNDLNGFHPTRETDFDYPWQDYKGIREAYEGRKKLEAYRKRSWFHPPYRFKPYVLNTEELATMYHFPGTAVRAPGIRRLPSKRGGSPINLPT